MMHTFHFLRPSWFLAFPILILLLWLHHHRRVGSDSWQAVCDPALLSHLLVTHSKNKTGQKYSFILFISGGLALFALAGPVWDQLEQPVFRQQSALVLVLDLSRSMDASDIAPTRLARARHKLVDILKKRKEGQTALIVYAAEPFVVSPLTQDAETIISQVSALNTELMPRQGSRPDRALEKAGALLKQAGVPHGQILLITDGLEHVPKESLNTAVAELQAQGHPLSILGIGTIEGAPVTLPDGGFLKDDTGAIVIPKLDELGLEFLARQGEGRYARLSVAEEDLEKLLEEDPVQRLNNADEARGMKADRWREEGPWLLLPLLPIAALAFRRGVLAMIFLLYLVTPLPAQALDWNELWSRQDQQGARLFEKKEEAAAAQRFKDPEWKAAAHYRAGEYEKSIQALEGIEHADAYYNKGNALAQLGRLPEALQSYDEALKREPTHADALYNREQVQEKLKQQNQENQQREGQGDQQQDQDTGDPSDTPKNESDRRNEQEKSQTNSDKQEDNTPGQTNPSQSPTHDDARNRPDHAQNDEKDKTTYPSDTPKNESNGRPPQAAPGERDESRQANEQWLRRIPDDPGGLLRRKFQYQSQQRRQTENNEEKAW